ncbi:MAG TPA: hypothetical protein VNK04_01700 [Gemmataceae bacterium]|nr:hypothetical protein [Gemmataceae bacterium]
MSDLLENATGVLLANVLALTVIAWHVAPAIGLAVVGVTFLSMWLIAAWRRR